jgi:large subunit ribosomal protein L13
MDEKIYMRHTGYPGGQRTLTAKVLQSKPCISRKAAGMLPKNKIGAELFRNLNVVGSEHKQGAQKTS